MTVATVQARSMTAAPGPKLVQAKPASLLFASAVRPHHRAGVAVRAAFDPQSTTIDPKYAQGNYPIWESMYKQLTEKYLLRSVVAEDAAALIEAGEAILLDVRLKESHEEAHPKGARNAPAFRVIRIGAAGGNAFASLLKGGLMLLNGVTPTESNPEFTEEVAAAAADGKILIFACEAGGAIAATTSFPSGKPSRSLKAAWRALYTETLPAERVLHLEGGVLKWYEAGLPMNGEYDSSKAFNTPNAVSAKTAEW